MKFSAVTTALVATAVIAGCLAGCAKTDACKKAAEASSVPEDQNLEAQAETTQPPTVTVDQQLEQIAKLMAHSPNFACTQYAQLLRNNISTGRLDVPAIANAVNEVIYKADRAGCL